MELLCSDNRLFVLDAAVLGQTAQVTIVQNAWNDRLANHATTLVVDQTGGQVVQLRYLCRLHLLEAFNVVVRLRVARELVTRCQVFEARGSVHSIREEDLVVDVDVLLNGLVWI